MLVPQCWALGSQVLPEVAKSCPPQAPQVVGYPHRSSSGPRCLCCAMWCHGDRQTLSRCVAPGSPTSATPQEFKRELYQCKVDVESLRHQGGTGQGDPPATLSDFRQRWDHLEEEIVSRQVGRGHGGHRAGLGGHTGRHECAGWACPGGAGCVVLGQRGELQVGTGWVLGVCTGLCGCCVGAVWVLGGCTGLCGHWVGAGWANGAVWALGGCRVLWAGAAAVSPDVAAPSRQHQLEAALLGLGQFQHQLAELLQWLSRTGEQLRGPAPLRPDLQSCEIELAKHKVRLRRGPGDTWPQPRSHCRGVCPWGLGRGGTPRVGVLATGRCLAPPRVLRQQGWAGCSARTRPLPR